MTRFKSVLRFVVELAVSCGNRGVSPITLPSGARLAPLTKPERSTLDRNQVLQRQRSDCLTTPWTRSTVTSLFRLYGHEDRGTSVKFDISTKSFAREVLLMLTVALAGLATTAAAEPLISDELKWQITLPNGTIDTCDTVVTAAAEARRLFTAQCSFTNLESAPDFYPSFTVNAHVLEADGTVSDLILVSNRGNVTNGVQANEFLALLTSDGGSGFPLHPAVGSIALGPEFEDGQLHDITALLGLQNAKITIQFMSDGDVPEPASYVLAITALVALLAARRRKWSFS